MATFLVRSSARVAVSSPFRMAIRRSAPTTQSIGLNSWRSYSSSGRLPDHDDAAAVQAQMDPDGFQTPYTNLPPLPRDPDESLQTIRARLTYQSRKRGILETDLLLSTFAKEFLKDMSIEDCRRFDKFMDEPDWDIYYWVTGKKDVPDRWKGDKVFEMIVKHSKNEGRVVRQMPAL